MTYTLVLLRHGESVWNAKNLFTGWWDADLTPLGEEEARRAGELLHEAGLLPDVAHTSLQARAIRTTTLALEPSARLAVLFAVGGRYRDAATYFERAYRIRPSVELAANAARAWTLAGEKNKALVWEARK